MCGVVKIVGWIVLAGLFAGCGGGSGASSNEVAETKKRGEAVAAVLEEYRKTNGKYPTRLEDLPAEMKGKIQEPTVWDKKWDYRVSAMEGVFVLRVSKGETMDPMMAYNSESKQWSGSGVDLGAK